MKHRPATCLVCGHTAHTVEMARVCAATWKAAGGRVR